ncbi:MAG: hypothetical protein R3196_09155 [Pseudidiomarina sp.]|nr:hypothetical protein [Pseudidiomarina sp.]
MTRIFIIERYQDGIVQTSLLFANDLGKNAASLIYVDPGIDAFKATLPRNVRRVLDTYDRFEKLRGILEEAEK